MPRIGQQSVGYIDTSRGTAPECLTQHQPGRRPLIPTHQQALIPRIINGELAFTDGKPGRGVTKMPAHAEPVTRLRT